MAEINNIPCDRCLTKLGVTVGCVVKGMTDHQLEHPTASIDSQESFGPVGWDFIPEGNHTFGDGYNYNRSYNQHIGPAYSLPGNPLGGSFNDVPGNGYINPLVLGVYGNDVSNGGYINPLVLGDYGNVVPNNEYTNPIVLEDHGNDDPPAKRGRGRPPGSKNKPKDPNAPPKEKRSVGRPRGPNYHDVANVRKRENKKRAEALKKEDGTSTPTTGTPTPPPAWAPAWAPAPASTLAPAPAPTLAFVQMAEWPMPEQVADHSDEYFSELLAPVAASVGRNSTHTAQDMQQ
jgi:hypothetical protein